jgi:3-oxoacyl-(acyl-carrier-protein) synthase
VISVGVIGWAWRTPLGHTVEKGIARLLAGERAAIPNPRVPAANHVCKLAAAIPGDPARSRNGRFLRRMGLWGMEAGQEALARSGIEGGPRVGLFSGVGGLRAHWEDMMPALVDQQEDGQDAWARGFRGLHPYWMLRHLSNNTHALLSVELGLRGEGATFGGANAGAQALSAASRALHEGAIDAALVMAHDSLLEPETLVELGARGAATQALLERLAAPYDQASSGFVPGEAAAALVLVRPDAARRPLALLSATNGADGERHEPDTRTIARVVGPLAHGATLIDGAGCARTALDAAEREALAAWFPDDVSLTATSSAMGQLGAATSLVQAIALAETLRRGEVPPIAGIERPAAGPLHPVVEVRRHAARAAVGISTGAPGLVGAVRVEAP